MFKDLRSFIEQIEREGVSANISLIGIPAIFGIVPPTQFPHNDNIPPDNGDDESDREKD